MADYKKKTHGDNEHLSNLTSAQNRWLDGSLVTPITIIPATSGGRLLRVVLNTNGSTVLLRSGSRRIATIASDAPEQTFYYGTYVENGLIAECGGAVDVTIVYDI